MGTPSQTSALPRSEQLQQLVHHLVEAKRLYGSAKQFARMTLEDPAEGVRAAEAAKGLTEALRLIQTLA